jgi:hypothetical protein
VPHTHRTVRTHIERRLSKSCGDTSHDRRSREGEDSFRGKDGIDHQACGTRTDDEEQRGSMSLTFGLLKTTPRDTFLRDQSAQGSVADIERPEQGQNECPVLPSTSLSYRRDGGVRGFRQKAIRSWNWTMDGGGRRMMPVPSKSDPGKIPVVEPSMSSAASSSSSVAGLCSTVPRRRGNRAAYFVGLFKELGMTILSTASQAAVWGRISPCHLCSFDQTPTGLLVIIPDRGSGGDDRAE